jgi:hypothetical protein
MIKGTKEPLTTLGGTKGNLEEFAGRGFAS